MKILNFLTQFPFFIIFLIDISIHKNPNLINFTSNIQFNNKIIFPKKKKRMRASRNIPLTRRQQKDQKPASRSMSSRSLTNSQVTSNYYFCHYKNAMYMGGMKSFQKNGIGIILHDNGSSSICNYQNDFKHGHHLIYTQNCLMSILYNKNKIYQSVMRTQQFIIYLKYNKKGYPDGKTILFNYQDKSIIYATYRNGTLIDKKQQKQVSILNGVYQLDNLQFLIGITHSKALRYQIDDSLYITCQKLETKFNVGFYKRGLINGLGFSFLFKPPNIGVDTYHNNNVKYFYLKPSEGGYFHNSQLCGLGAKWFKNGNYYFGDFKNNIFQGRGMLKNSVKNNWAFGSFQQGNMTELIEYSHEGDLTRQKKLIQALHERKSTWIQKQIHVQSPQIFLKQIQRILSNKQALKIKTLEEKKQLVLKRIQENFICENPENILQTPHRNYSDVTPENINKRKQNQNQIYAKSSRKLYSDSQYQSPIQSTQRHKMSPIKQIKLGQLQNPQKTNYKPQHKQKSITNIRLIEIPNKHEQTLKKKKQSTISPARYSSNQIINMEGLQKTMNFSLIKEQQQSQKFDQKKMIGRSRLFKYLPKYQKNQEDPPHFNYGLRK